MMVAKGKSRSHRLTMRTLLTLSLSIAILLLAGCTSTTRQGNQLAGGYRLTKLQEITIPQSLVVLMRVAEGSLSGKGPVNQWSAQIVDGTIGGMISTRQSSNPELMQIEAQLFDALIGSKLTKDGKDRISFVKDKKTVAKATLVVPARSN